MLINKQANYGNLEAFLFPTELTVLEAVANFSCETTLNNMLSTLRILPSKGTSVILLSLINFVPDSLSLLFAATKVIFGVENIVNFFSWFDCTKLYLCPCSLARASSIIRNIPSPTKELLIINRTLAPTDLSQIHIFIISFIYLTVFIRSSTHECFCNFTILIFLAILP